MRRLLRLLQRILRVQPGRPAVLVGLRAAVAVTVPFAIGSLLGWREAGWTGLTGLLVTLADTGGSYLARARAMGAVTALGALAGALAAPAGGWLALDVPLLLVGVTAASFARCYGETAGSVGEKVAVIFIASLGLRELGWDGALERGEALLFGGMWAMLQGLLLWPVQPYRPARAAISGLYDELAASAGELAGLSRAGASPQEWARAIAAHSSIRLRIEQAREALAVTRVGREDESRRGEHLLALLEQSEPATALLFALAHAMEVASPAPHLRPVREQVAEGCERYAALARWAAVVARDPKRAARLDPPAEGGVALPEPALRELPSTVSELLIRLRDNAHAVLRAASAMQRGYPVPQGQRVALPRIDTRRSLWEPVRDSLGPHSVVLRHALRAGLVAAASLWVARALGLSEAHWVVLSAVGILQPYSASTEERALQRVVGTLLGATLAALIATAIVSPWARLEVIGALTLISVSLLPLNFGAFQILLTPDLLLLASLSAGDWSVAENRALGVVLACALALAGVWLLWPNPERHRFPDAAAEVLRADGLYFRQVAANRSGTAPEVHAARRDFGLALLDAEASFDRLMAEYRGPAQKLEPAMALLTYSRRLAASVTALGEERAQVHSEGLLDQIAHQASHALETLADSLRRRRRPPPLPRLPVRRPGDDPVSGELIERVPRQLRILRGAVKRLAQE